jgi:hypothetical protein
MPARKPEPPPDADNPEQSRRFIDMAREVEADESPGATDRAFKKVIPSPPPSTKRKVLESPDQTNPGSNSHPQRTPDRHRVAGR